MEEKTEMVQPHTFVVGIGITMNLQLTIAERERERCHSRVSQGDERICPRVCQITRLQRRIVEMGEATDAIDKTWDSRITAAATRAQF
eukprot:4632658-Amphidinium_carterae.1